MSDWLGPHRQPCLGEKEHENKYRAQSWPSVWGLADGIYCVSGQVEHVRDTEVI